MAAVEITPYLVFSAGGCLISMLVATWALSRRSRSWDDSESHQLALYGDPKKGELGLVQKNKQLEDTVEALAKQLKSLKSALNAHGSDEHIIVAAVQRTIADHAHEAATAARRHLIEEQNERFVIVEEAERPALGPRPTGRRQLPIVPRVDPDDPPKFDPEGTGRNKRIR